MTTEGSGSDITQDCLADMTSQAIQRERSFRFHDALKRTGSLLGEDNLSKEWISETRSNFAEWAGAALPGRRAGVWSGQRERIRRHVPQPRVLSLVRARHGQRNVCAVDTLLPEEKETETTQKSAYMTEFKGHYVTPFRVKSAPISSHGILPSCRIPLYDDVRKEILLPVEISEKSPSTNNPNKYMARRRRVEDDLNQHRNRETPYGLQSTPSVGRVQRHLVTNQGRELSSRRHLPPPCSSLPVAGFNGGAPRLADNTMHAQLLPFLRGPRII